MTPDEHYQHAEKVLEAAVEVSSNKMASYMVNVAQVHATLATCQRVAPTRQESSGTDSDFSKALASLLNRHGWDSACGIPDFVLSEFLQSVLKGLRQAASTGRRHCDSKIEES